MAELNEWDTVGETGRDNARNREGGTQCVRHRDTVSGTEKVGISV